MLSTVGHAIDQTSRRGLTPASGCAAEALMAMTGGTACDRSLTKDLWVREPRRSLGSRAISWAAVKKDRPACQARGTIILCDA
jgi:hypothetical protein